MAKKALELLQEIYRDETVHLHTRIRCAVEALPFEEPKLSAVAHASLTGQDFAAMLDRAIQRSLAGPPGKLIEAQAIEVEPEH
jgi:hypothetical protein